MGLRIHRVLRDTATFPFRQRQALMRVAATPVRMAFMITLIVNIVIFLGFQFPIFVGVQGFIDAALNLAPLIIYLVWCSYAAAAIRLACGDGPGIERFRLSRPEVEFAFAAIVCHAAVAALVTVPVIFILTVAGHLRGTVTPPQPYFIATAILFAGIALRIITALTVVARGSVVNPAQVLRDTLRDLPRFTILGLIVGAVVAVVAFALSSWWQVASPTWRGITNIAAPFLLQVLLLIYGAFLAGLLGAIHCDTHRATDDPHGAN